MKGFLILSEGRSGTEWLRSMTNATGVLGTADEWLMVDVLDGPSSPAKAAEHLDAVVVRASTPNGMSQNGASTRRRIPCRRLSWNAPSR